MTGKLRAALALVVLGAGLAACGGDSEDKTDATPIAAATTGAAFTEDNGMMAVVEVVR